MPAQVSIQTVDALGAEIYVSFNLVLSGNYPTGGEPLNFTGGGVLPATQDPGYVGLVAAIESLSLLQVDCWSQGGDLAFQFVPVVSKTGNPPLINPATGAKLKISASGTFGTEHAAAPYEAGLTGDIITGFAIFAKL